MSELKQVILVNMELGMSRGKIAAQVAHAAVEASLLSINRKEFSEWYDEKFHNTGITPLTQKKDRKSAHHLYVLKVIDSNQDNKKLYNYLYQKGIGVNLHYIPIYKQPFFQKKMVNLNIKELSTENADKYYSQALTLPLHPRMTLEMLEYIVNKIYIFFD